MTEEEKQRAKSQAVFDRLRNYGKKPAASKTEHSKLDDQITQEELNFAFDSSDANLSEWIDTSDVSEGEDNVLP